MLRAFQIHASDNVAVLLEDAPAGAAFRHPREERSITLSAAICLGHKVALSAIPIGGSIIKFGCRIGHATCSIVPGDWVHLHNCASDFDERSGTLDGESGAPTDMSYE
jgi:altronate hydrolase/altronate dehydratase small subunit